MAKRRSIGSVILIAIVSACSATVPSAPPTTRPAASSTTPAPIATDSPDVTAWPTAPARNRPSLDPGAPTISDPYWLLHTGHAGGTWKDASGRVIRIDSTESYEVIDGGWLDGAILTGGQPIGTLEVTTTTGDSRIGVTPVEEQYGALIDSPRPKNYPAPASGWVRRVGAWGATTVYVKELAQPPQGGGVDAIGLWWIEAGSTWAMLQISGDAQIDEVLAALFRAAR